MRFFRRFSFTVTALMLSIIASHANAAIDTLILHSSSSAAPPETQLFDTGLFSSVDSRHEPSLGLPTLAELLNYDSVLAFSNSPPTDSVGFGNLLADYVDAGGHVVLSTYAFSDPWAIQGRITDPGYSPLVNMGANSNVSGNLVATMVDSIFSGVDLGAVAYFHNGNFAQPGLDAGSTLLATDGAGVNLLARNAAGSVIGANLFPGDIEPSNDELYKLFANALQPVIPEPASCTLALLGLGLIGRRRR